MSARSFSASVTSPDGLHRPLAAVRAEVRSPSAGLVFVSGSLTQELERVTAQVRSVWKGVPTCVVPAAGVLTERGELEGVSAASCLLWGGGRATPFALAEGSGPGGLRDLLAGTIGDQAATVLLFPRSDFTADLLERAVGAAPAAWLFGAGAVGGAALTIDAAGDVLTGRAAGLVVRGLAPPLVQSPVACKRLTPFEPIEETSGGLVLRVGGQPALELLSSCLPAVAGSTTPQPVVCVALADAEEAAARLDEGLVGLGSEPAEPRFVIRPVRGVDPGRRGVMVGGEARPGGRLAFAVRDAFAGRSGVESSARLIARQALGSAPRFALFLTCAGRGQGLYGTPDVEARILRQRFGDLPIAGMHGAFEITPWGPGEARLAVHSAVLALFRSPS